MVNDKKVKMKNQDEVLLYYLEGISLDMLYILIPTRILQDQFMLVILIPFSPTKFLNSNLH